MNFILFDGRCRDYLLPLTYTRPVCDLRVGILTIREKWQKYLKAEVSFATQEYLSEKYKLIAEEDNLLINGSVLPDETLLKEILKIKKDECLKAGSKLIAYRTDYQNAISFNASKTINCTREIQFSGDLQKIHRLWDIFRLNGSEIEKDFKLLTKGRKSAEVSTTNTLIMPERIFVEEGAVIEASVLNAKNGYIYIGRNAEIMEGSLVRGPFALCDNAILKMGAKIYGPTTVGPYSKVGGEVNNSIIIGYSNKAHDGFIGQTIIGEWCNIGACTVTSNLKNNYANVKLWSYPDAAFVDTGLQFCGLIMGDHSKIAINAMINTGSVIGVSCNIFGSGFPRNFIPSFTWGGAAGYTVYKPEKAFKTAEIVMNRRKKQFSNIDKKILTHIFNISSGFRNF